MYLYSLHRCNLRFASRERRECLVSLWLACTLVSVLVGVTPEVRPGLRSFMPRSKTHVQSRL